MGLCAAFGADAADSYAAFPESAANGVTPYADSLKTLWPGNGHYYKRYDNQTITWTDAQKACQALGANLATITSDGEQSFVWGLVSGSPLRGWFAIGANDIAVHGAWQWVTGEASGGWTYSHWWNGEPSSGDYMAMQFVGDGTDGYWFSGDNSPSHGYVCEWSTNTYIGTAAVPDQNANNYPEDAILYVDFTTSLHTVILKDRKSPHAAVGIKLTYAQNDIPPKGLAVIADTNGNGKLEIAVLDQNYSTNMPIVRVKDISNNAAYIHSFQFFTDGNYRPVSLAVEPDANANGSNELTVTALHKDTGKAYTETRDSKTGGLLYTNAF